MVDDQYRIAQKLLNRLHQRPAFPELQKITRRCYKCGQNLYFGGCVQTVTLYGEMEYFGLDFLEEIWRNSLFVIECCWCFVGMASPAVLAVRSMERIRRRIKNE